MLRSRIVSVPRWPPSGTVNMVLLPAALRKTTRPARRKGRPGIRTSRLPSIGACFGRNDGGEKIAGRMGAAGQAGNGVKFPCPSWRTLRIRGGVVEGVFLASNTAAFFERSAAETGERTAHRTGTAQRDRAYFLLVHLVKFLLFRTARTAPAVPPPSRTLPAPMGIQRGREGFSSCGSGSGMGVPRYSTS